MAGPIGSSPFTAEPERVFGLALELRNEDQRWTSRAARLK